MFRKLNVTGIEKEHRKSFFTNGKISTQDKFQYFYLPYLIALILCLLKLPDNDLKNLLGTSLSIFIGLFLNVIAILISQVNSRKKYLNFSEQKIRLSILRDTIYNILFSLIQSIKALVVLYLMSFVEFNETGLGELSLILFSTELDYILTFILSLLLFKYNVALLFSFYVMTKNIVALFKKDIELEEFHIRKEQNEVEL